MYLTSIGHAHHICNTIHIGRPHHPCSPMLKKNNYMQTLNCLPLWMD